MRIRSWGHDRTHAAIRLWPRVIRFLGCVPFSVDGRLPERLQAYREVHGLTKVALARKLEVDPSTVDVSERGVREPAKRSKECVERLLGGQPCALPNRNEGGP